MTHITKIAFCGLRRLNPFNSLTEEPLAAWCRERNWFDFGVVNVFIGANGAGKSTVLELIDLLRNPERLVTLARENRNAYGLRAFDFIFSDSAQLLGAIVPNRIANRPDAVNIDPIFGGLKIQCVTMLGRKLGKTFFNFYRNISKIELDADSHTNLTEALSEFGIHVAYWTPSIVVPIAALVAELNAARTHLCGILSESESMDEHAVPGTDLTDNHAHQQPFSRIDDTRLGIYLSDDTRQHNHVAVEALPAGWRQIASILAWLRNVPESAVCLLEEPETHLHPHLQRYLARQIGEIAKERSLQLFIATHSTVFQQLNAWPYGAHLFEVRPTELCTLNSAWRVLDALGIKGSDLSQSNGIVWVEGPSDRIYIKHWMKLYCQANGLTEPLENVEYSFAFYGGASLSHFGIDETESFIDMIGINRNAAIVIDRDNDFVNDDAGNLVCTHPGSSKQRVLSALHSFGNKHTHAWVTDGNTIESYLPDATRTQHFDVDNGRLVPKISRSKVAIANQYIRSYSQFDGCTCCANALSLHIRDILDAIKVWNR